MGTKATTAAYIGTAAQFGLTIDDCSKGMDAPCVVDAPAGWRSWTTSAGSFVLGFPGCRRSRTTGDMPALGAGLIGLYMAWLMYRNSIQRHGGWRYMDERRRGVPVDMSYEELRHHGLADDWQGYSTFDRGWFWLVPIFGAISVLFVVLGVALIVLGQG